MNKENSTQNVINSSQTEIIAFNTARTIAHRIQLSDLDNLYALQSNAEVAATIGGIHSFQETEKILHISLEHWEKYGFGFWLFHDVQTGAFIGRGGLRLELIENVEEIALSYALMPQYWHKGLATEIAKAIIKIGFEQLNLESIVGFTNPTNERSQRVMKKNGFEYEKNFNHTRCSRAVLYRLTKKQYIVCNLV